MVGKEIFFLISLLLKCGIQGCTGRSIGRNNFSIDQGDVKVRFGTPDGPVPEKYVGFAVFYLQEIESNNNHN